jgi:hypothetical protein
MSKNLQVVMFVLGVGVVLGWLLSLRGPTSTLERIVPAQDPPVSRTPAPRVDEGTDPARPSLPPEDAGFVDTRGGWGWGDKCWIHIKAGKWGWAKAECDQGMAMSPASPQPRASLLYNEGLIAKAAGRVGDARRNFVDSLALREHPEVRAALNSLPP